MYFFSFFLRCHTKAMIKTEQVHFSHYGGEIEHQVKDEIGLDWIEFNRSDRIPEFRRLSRSAPCAPEPSMCSHHQLQLIKFQELQLRLPRSLEDSILNTQELEQLDQTSTTLMEPRKSWCVHKGHSVLLSLHPSCPAFMAHPLLALGSLPFSSPIPLLHHLQVHENTSWDPTNTFSIEDGSGNWPGSRYPSFTVGSLRQLMSVCGFLFSIPGACPQEFRRTLFVISTSHVWNTEQQQQVENLTSSTEVLVQIISISGHSLSILKPMYSQHTLYFCVIYLQAINIAFSLLLFD